MHTYIERRVINMIDSYKNILANKYMADTNYIIIKDTDDLEDLERQYELFLSQMTVRQQRRSDDRSIEIWNMTNKQHYEQLKSGLLSKKELHNDKDNQDTYTDIHGDEEDIKDEDITNLISSPFKSDTEDEEYNTEEEESVDESTKLHTDTVSIHVADDNPVPTKQTEEKPKTIMFSYGDEREKERLADQYEIDTNIYIIGHIKGTSHQEMLQSLEKDWINFNSQSHDLRKKSDDKCREIFGMSNLDRYKKLKSIYLDYINIYPDKQLTTNDNGGLELKTDEVKLEFVSQVYENMLLENKQNLQNAMKHKRLNDCPYFTPEELIDMGVHRNHNWYSDNPDNEALISNISVSTWFDSYKSMCKDQIFEDYRKDWIRTLEKLYSDFEQIKESGNEEKILARKQSILDLGWNPEIPFTRKNRVKAAKRVSNILCNTRVQDIFIDMTADIPDDEIVDESASTRTHKPVFLVFVNGNTPIISDGIKLFTKSVYSHAAIAFSSNLKPLYSYNMFYNGKSGMTTESLTSYKNNDIAVVAFYVPNKQWDDMQDKVDSYISHKTRYDISTIFQKMLHIDKKLIDSDYRQVCSTFVDNILQAGQVDLTKGVNLPDPGQLYTASKNYPNKIIEIYNGPASKYDSKQTDKKLRKLLKMSFLGIEESTNILTEAIVSNKEDYMFNVDSLAPNTEHNILFITGHSGAGKTTLINEYKSKYRNSICISGDYITLTSLYANIPDSKWFYPDGKKYQKVIAEVPIIGKYFDANIDRIRKTVPKFDAVHRNFECKEVIDVNIDFINFLRAHIPPRYIAIYEGTQVLDFPIEMIQNEPLIIKGTSALTSYIRKQKRDIDLFHKPIQKTYNSLINMIPVYIDSEKKISNIVSNMESTNILTEAVLPAGYSLRPATDMDKKYMYEYEIKSVDPAIADDDKTQEYIRDDVIRSIKDTKMIVYKGQTVGMITASSIDGGKYWYIGEIYLDKPHRNKGIGTTLIKDEMSRHDKIKLQVAQSNTKAKSLYESLGFKVIEKNDEAKMYVMLWEKPKSVTTESYSIFNEVKQFPIEFDKEGNLIIYKAKIGSLDYSEEINDSVKLLDVYRNTNNIEGMKYELAKLWFINDQIEKRLKKRLNNEDYKAMIDTRAICLNTFKYNLEYVLKTEKGFNFSDYYNSTPFSDNSVKVTANTIKYTTSLIKSMI